MSLSFINIIQAVTLDLRPVVWIVCLLVWSRAGRAGGAWEPRVALRQGTLAGVLVYGEDDSGAGAAAGRGSRPVRAFLAVPYAAPPVAGLRLQPPQRHPGWNGTLRAQRPGPLCAHLGQIEREPTATSSEDCLYLDVWTPEGASGNLPVLAWLWGSSEPAPPCQDLASGGAVVATVRFRRGPLALGALGLLDQYMALVWLRSNAPNFGGDSKALTLLGKGSAADDVLHHFISPRTNGLVSRFAAMSPTLSGLRSEGPRRARMQLAQESQAAELLGCGRPQSASAPPAADRDRLAYCYRDRALHEIITAYNLAFKEPWWEWPVADTWLPREQQYLPVSLGQWLLNRDAQSSSPADLLMGHLSDESPAVATSNIAGVLVDDVVEQIARQFSNSTIAIDLISDAIRWEYARGGGAGGELAADRDASFWRLCDALSSRIEHLYVYHLKQEVGDVDEEALIAGGATLRQAERKSLSSGRPPRQYPPLREHLLHYASAGSPLTWWRPWTRSSPYVCELDGEAAAQGDQKIGSRSALRSALFWVQYLPRLRNFFENYVHTGSDYKLSSSASGGELGVQLVQPAELSVRGGLIGGICALLVLLFLMVLLLKRSSGWGAVTSRGTTEELYRDEHLGSAQVTGWRRFIPDLGPSHQGTYLTST